MHLEISKQEQQLKQPHLVAEIKKRRAKEKEKVNLRTKCLWRVVFIPLIKCLSSNPTRVIHHKLDLYRQCKDLQYQSITKERTKKNMVRTQPLISIPSSGHVEEPNQERSISQLKWNPKPLLLGKLLCLMKPEIALSNYQMEPMIKISRFFFL